jgi:hypothetical protein
MAHAHHRPNIHHRPSGDRPVAIKPLYDRTSFPAPLSDDRLAEIEADGWELAATARGPDGQPREFEFVRSRRAGARAEP